MAVEALTVINIKKKNKTIDENKKSPISEDSFARDFMFEKTNPKTLIAPIAPIITRIQW